MKEINDARPVETQPDDHDPGLIEALASLRVSPGFEKRCEEAAMLAFAVEKIRRERELRGFLPIRVDSYLERLARYAGVQLNAVLQWANIPDLRPSSEHAHGLARLLQTVGFSLEESLALVRVSFCEQLGFAVLPSRINYRGEGVLANELESASLALDEMEREYSSRDKAELRSILGLVNEAYGGL